MRSFCDATFEAAERRYEIIDRLLAHIHGLDHRAVTPTGRLPAVPQGDGRRPS